MSSLAVPAKASCPPVVWASKAQEDGVRRAIAQTTGGQLALAGTAVSSSCPQSLKDFTITTLVLLGCLSVSVLAHGQTLVPGQSQLQKEVLAAHNKLRAKHHSPPLVWDEELQAFARKHALACQFRHSLKDPYGENLAAGYPSASAAILAWYAEGAQYSYQQPGYSHASGHFTQLIWAGSKKVGCAYVACKGLQGTPGNYLVCEYSPAGNITNPGYFARNVLPAY